MSLAEGKQEDNVSSIVAQAFTTAQQNTAAHPRAVSLLLRAYRIDSVFFLHEFIKSLNRVLLVFSRTPPVERLVVFLSRFTAENTKHTAEFCSQILKHLIQNSTATSRAVRFRTVQIIASTLNAFPEDATLSDDVWDSLQECLINRSFDKLPRVRAAAAGALCRVQAVDNPDEDEVGIRLLEMASSDSSAAARKAALNAIAFTEYTIPRIVAKTRDVSDDVRCTVYQNIARKLPPENISIPDRIAVLCSGLRDRSELVRTACAQDLLLDAWLDGACKGNVFELIELLGGEKFEEEVLQVLRFLFVSERCNALLNAISIDVNNMRSPDVLILRAMSHTPNAQHCLQKFLPTTSLYAKVLGYYALDKLATRHLLDLCRGVDMSDEVGRIALEGVLRSDFLSSRGVGEEVIPCAVRALRAVTLDIDTTIRVLLEILENEILVEPASEAEECVKVEAEDMEWRSTRSLSICLETLRVAPQRESSAASSTTLCMNMVKIAVIPQLMSEDEETRRAALECLGLYCLLDRSGDEALSKMPLFLQAIKTDVPAIEELGLKIIADFLMVFDFVDDAISTSASTPGKTPRAKQKDAANFSVRDEAVNLLTENLSAADGNIRTTAVRGIARLLFLRRISPTAKLLSHLLILHHNPITEDDGLLRQCLSLFFPSFCMASSLNRVALEDAFKPTCNVLLAAPSSSPLSKIDVVQVAQFILHLTGLPHVQSSTEIEVIGRPTSLIHERMANTALNELVDACEDDDKERCIVYSKMLRGFRFSWRQENDDYLRKNRILASIALDKCEDRRTRNIIAKFLERMDSVLEDQKCHVVEDEVDKANGQQKQVSSECAGSDDQTILSEMHSETAIYSATSAPQDPVHEANSGGAPDEVQKVRPAESEEKPQARRRRKDRSKTKVGNDACDENEDPDFAPTFEIDTNVTTVGKIGRRRTRQKGASVSGKD